MKEFIYRIEDNESDESEVFTGWIRKQGRELIRCRECKHHFYHDMLKQDYCDITNIQFGEVEPDGYCHRGERKEK